MISLDLINTSPMSIQEVGTIEFFLNTPKKVASVQGNYVEYYKEYLKGYPMLVVNPEKGMYSSIIIAKDDESLEEYKKAMGMSGDERFRRYGELYGFPPTAIDFFVDKTKDRISKFKVTYYGLGFVCARDEEGLAKVEKELLEMYGLTLHPKYYNVIAF